MKVECSITAVTDKIVIGKTIIDGRNQSNAGAIAFKDFIVVIDPSPETYTAKEFRNKIENHFNLPIKYILATHYHNDHTNGLEVFEDTIIIGSHELRKKLANRKKQYLPELLVKNQLTIKDASTELNIFHEQGHTDCSVFAYSPKEKVIFAGDLVFSKDFPWAGDSSCDPDKWIAFYEKILTYDYTYLIPGHGPLAGKEEIQEQLDLMLTLKTNTLQAIAENKSLDDIPYPTKYVVGNERRISITLKHFYNFYSQK